jgi:hypothetical protein
VDLRGRRLRLGPPGAGDGAADGGTDEGVTIEQELLAALKEANWYLRASHPDWVRNHTEMLQKFEDLIVRAEKLEG